MIAHKKQQIIRTIFVLAAAMIRYAKADHDSNCVCSSSNICTNCMCITSVSGTNYIGMHANPVAVSCTIDADVRLNNTFNIKLKLVYNLVIYRDLTFCVQVSMFLL